MDIYVNVKGKNYDSQFDISEEGACLQSTNCFMLNDFILLHFIGQKDSAIAEVKFSILSKVMWVKEICNGQYKYGVQFRFFNDPFSKQQKNAMMTAFKHFELVAE
ncbi:MAG: PilZ domain-containing protein [Chitinivibrionales bacterium]|nr:PilZ domain-containing protein [Chitinivibrionales bacterium]